MLDLDVQELMHLKFWSYTKKVDTKINNIIKVDTERKCLKWQKISTMKILKDQLLDYIKNRKPQTQLSKDYCISLSDINK